MHYFEFGRRDATIYSGGTTASINTGFDEILEVNKVVNDNGTIGNVSRVLIDFDYAYISESIQNGRIPSTAKFYLNLKNQPHQYLHLILVAIQQLMKLVLLV